MNPSELEFVENLRRERTKAGFKQREVAELLNLNRSTYSYYENLKAPHMPDIDTICKIAEIFGCDVSALLPKSKNTVIVSSPNSGTANKEISATPEEQRLLNLFRSCNDEAKKRIMMNALNIVLEASDENKNK